MPKTGRRKRAPGSREQQEAREAGRQRIIYRSGHSWVVAVPHWGRLLLARVSGGAVYWHEAGKGRLILSDSPTRADVSRVMIELQQEVGRLRRDNERLRARVQARPLKLAHEAENVGYMKAARYYTKLDGDLQEVLRRQEILADMIAVPPWKRWRGPRTPSPSAPPPSPDVSAGEAVTPGAEPPGDPQEHHEAERVPQP